MANLQHLELINRGQMDQGKCFKILSYYQKAKLFYYIKKDYLMKELRQILIIDQNQQLNEKLSQKKVQITIQLAKVFNNLGQLFKATGQNNIYKIYSEKSMIMINSLSAQEKISKGLQQINSQIRFIYYSSFFEWQQILNLKKLTLFMGNYKNSKSRRKVIKVCNQITISIGKAKIQKDYQNKAFNQREELMKQIKAIGQIDQQMYNIIQTAQFLKALNPQTNKNCELNQKNYKQSNFSIKFVNQLFYLAKFNCESQLGQFCDWIEIEDAITNLTKCLYVFMINKEKYLSQIIKIFSILSIYYIQNQDQIKSEMCLTFSKKLLQQNLCQKNYLISDIKDTQAYINFNRGWKLKSLKYLQLSKQLSQQSQKMKIQLWGKQHLSLLVPLNNQAIFYANKTNYDDAIVKFKQALQICQKNQNFDRKNLYVILLNLAYVYNVNGKKNQGKKYIQESLKIQKQIFQSNNCGYDQKQLMQEMQYIQNQNTDSFTLSLQKTFKYMLENLTIESYQRFTLEAYMNS